MSTVVLTKEAQKDFNSLPTVIKGRVQNILTRLRDWPEVSGAKPMQYDYAGSFRIRTGAYRVVFWITDLTVTVYEIKDRKDAYRD